ncbi:HAD-IA family hydrolase [Azotosporobacter soli]|uniref:HAD family hydrolase n=1 Tax=Azotosporobacter soli TaxID=3055040 RepID=UPI0031FEECEB
MKKYETLVFDVDGTLIDTETVNQLALQKVLLDELGREHTLAELAAVCGIPGTRGLTLLGVEDAEGIMEKWIDNVKFWRDKIALYPGIEAVVRMAAERGVTLGIVTSRTKTQLAAEPLVTHLVKQIPYVICADDTVKHKPNPDPLLKFLALSGANAATALYIGDTVHDLSCAKEAGVDFALALWGTMTKDLLGPDYRLEKPSDILTLLKPLETQMAR